MPGKEEPGLVLPPFDALPEYPGLVTFADAFGQAARARIIMDELAGTPGLFATAVTEYASGYSELILENLFLHFRTGMTYVPRFAGRITRAWIFRNIGLQDASAGFRRKYPQLSDDDIAAAAVRFRGLVPADDLLGSVGLFEEFLYEISNLQGFPALGYQPSGIPGNISGALLAYLKRLNTDADAAVDGILADSENQMTQDPHLKLRIEQEFSRRLRGGDAAE